MLGEFDNLGQQHEQEANSVIAEWLNTTAHDWRAIAERVGVLQGTAGRPDIVIRQHDRMPVIVESEYGSPAVKDAEDRLGETLIGETRPFTEVIALGIDSLCRQDSRSVLRGRLDRNESVFSVQFVSQRNDGSRVWPDKPLMATPADLVAYCEYAQVPQAVIDAKSDEIANKVLSASLKLAMGLRSLPNGSDGVLSELVAVVGGSSTDQAMQTACAIWLTAIDLQNDLATYSPRCKQLGLEHTGRLGTLTQAKLIRSWETIRRVNYLPVVELAIPSLRSMPSGINELSDVLSELAGLSDELNDLHAKHIYNFAGELWQKLVIDRAERAAHYTKPEVAEMLARLGAARFAGRDASELAKIDLMDAACGTGTLIGAGERALRRLYRNQGGEDLDLHKTRMENHIVAIDVNGIAGTLTAKRLTDMDVQQMYEGSKIAVTDHPAGSLSLLDPEQTSVSEVLCYRNVTQAKDQRENFGLFHIGLEDAGVDWSLMNPPYSRPRIGRSQATKGLARLRTKAKRQGYTLSNGPAGLGSDFGNLSLMRMKGDGVLSHVLPLTAAHADSWQQWRTGIETHYRDLVAITNVGRIEESMSADTGMNEMLVVATKRKGVAQSHIWEEPKVLCVNLYAAPSNLSEGYALANHICEIPNDQEVGITEHFSFARISVPTPGFSWYGVGNTSHELTGISAALMRGDCWDPIRLRTNPLEFNIRTLGAFCESGPTHHQLGHPSDAADAIGAFRWFPVNETASPSAHRSLWAADADTQTRLILQHTHNGEVWDQSLATRMVERRSLWFLSRNLRWTSQAVAFANTTDIIHGGNAWNALQRVPDDVGRCLSLFYNSIFGAIIRRSYAQSTQPGRAMIHVKAIRGLPCLDFGEDTPAATRARTIASMWFNSHAALELEPFAYCFRDSNRHQIDSTVTEMLGLNHSDPETQAMLAHYRLLFSSEPNVNGRNKRILAALKKFQK